VSIARDEGRRLLVFVKTRSFTPKHTSVTHSGPRAYITTDEILVVGCPFVLVIETVSIILHTVTRDCCGYRATGLDRDEAHMVHARTHVHLTVHFNYNVAACYVFHTGLYLPKVHWCAME
jgi:hypothetical protein